ncbi:DUF3866 family protein [Dehalobacterium formicoaceticum]|uniref:DUF3866 family protein n=1 Tax=Dehalobacterium formicoaceticum TaxID=51515 RepID=A0ABT1Y4L0_9FIRM|nr:DUF3866 family protein [Dehalobacterium formicoaceticum]MCR6545811.1 DUF3866 family protein [Dehalobacterium formicoaceticum]
MERIESKIGKVKNILMQREGFSEIEVALEGRLEKAINYEDLTGKIDLGDRVLLNTTGVKLGLGTGGYHFVETNLSHPLTSLAGKGHIMKLNYTPQQIKVLSVEEEAAGFQEVFNNFHSLEGLPVMIFSLHSALAPLVLSYKLIQPQARLAYIMTDGGALPAAFSHTLARLKEEGWIKTVLTSGHTFGGDYEAVNIYSALIAAKEIAGADAVLMGLGPGHVGTGTKWGFSAIQLGEGVNAVNILGGRPIFCPRISFLDPRLRHQGISHQSLTILSQVTLSPALVVLPHLPEEQEKMIKQQIEAYKIEEKHSVIWEHGKMGWEHLQETSYSFQTMGRGLSEDQAYFLGICAGGIYAAKIAEGKGFN